MNPDEYFSDCCRKLYYGNIWNDHFYDTEDEENVSFNKQYLCIRSWQPRLDDENCIQLMQGEHIVMLEEING